MKLLLALAVELRDIRDGGDLPEEAQIFEAAHQGIRSTRLRHPEPAHLVLDVLNVGLDAGCGGGRLLVLQPEQRVAVLAVVEVEPDRPARDEREGDEHGEVARILEEEGTAPRHSITRSACVSSSAEIINPSALAVLRLTTSSSLVGCSTGTSPAFAPSRILAT